MAESARLTGRCHCGNIEVELETRAPERVALRACACSFCRRHGARTVSDPGGRARITVGDPARVNRYRFALGTADFLVCTTCGVYAAAVYSDEEGAWAILNANTLREREALTAATDAVSYDGESEAERRRRRRAKWTPVAELRWGPGDPGSG